MAYLDSDSGAVTLQVVYDGAPYSGKTASLQFLGQILKREVTSMESDDGRTLFFDWLEYEGGALFDLPIQCRVMSVPGQPALAERRRAILSVADSVVFVADTTEQGYSQSLQQFKDLNRQLAQRRRKVPVLLQLNKSDLSEPDDREKAAEGFETESRLTVDTVAIDGTGIRESFMLAISETVRSMKSAGELYSLGDDGYETLEFQLPSSKKLFEILGGDESTDVKVKTLSVV